MGMDGGGDRGGAVRGRSAGGGGWDDGPGGTRRGVWYDV